MRNPTLGSKDNYIYNIKQLETFIPAFEDLFSFNSPLIHLGLKMLPL